MLGRSDIVRELSAATVAKGQAIQRMGGVRRIVIADDSSTISGSVQGSAPRPYSQIISLKPRGNVLAIEGHCSCPMNYNCKHVAAVLLGHIEAGATETARDVFGEPPATNRAASASSPGSLPRALSRSELPAAPLRPALSPSVAQWLDRLSASVAPPVAIAQLPTARQRELLFVLNHELPSYAMATAGRVRIRAMTAHVRSDGRLTDVKLYDVEQINRPPVQRPRYFTETDETILRDLHWLNLGRSAQRQDDIALEANRNSLRVIEALLQSGKLRYGTAAGPVLRAGPSSPATLAWIKTGGDRQQLVFVRPAPATSTEGVPHGTAAFDIVLPLDPPHYIDWGSGLVGAIVSELPGHIAVQVAMAPPIAATEAAVVKAMMRQRLPARSARPRPVKLPTAVNLATGERIFAEPDADPESSHELMVLPLPEAPDNIETRLVEPVPRLELFVAKARLKQYWYATKEHHRGELSVPAARLSFDYDGTVVPIHAKTETLERLDGEKLILTPRDHRREIEAMDRLKSLGLKIANGLPIDIQASDLPCLFLAPAGQLSMQEFLEDFDEPMRFIQFSAEALPPLLADGWQIAYSDDYPYRIADGATAWWADIGEGSGIDWFSFELGIEFEGHRINLIPQLASMLAELPAEMMELAISPDNKPEDADAFVAHCRRLRLYHTLPDGRLLPLPGDRLAPVLKSLLELIGPRQFSVDDGKISLHRGEAGALAKFAAGAGTDVAWAANAERLIELGQKLRGGYKIKKVKPPRTFKASLRPYQTDGLAWMNFLAESGFGGVLADDMGLGKTVQALAFLAREKAEGRLDKPALIVSPTSVLPNWQAEVEKFAPGLSVLALRGLERRGLFGEIENHDLILTTYPLLARDHEVLLDREFHIAILDEAQAIKNPKATISGIAHRINARHRLALTGTPLENNLGEVWSLFQFLAPGLLGNESTFRRTFRTPIEKHGDPAAQAFLSRRLRPFMLRRTKAEVATELPPKTEITERIRLEGGQRDLYETVRSLMHEKVREEIAKKGIAKSHIIFLDALLKLRQVCCDPRLLKMAQARKVKTSAKLERLMEMIPQLVGEGRRILLFSQFTSMLDLIKVELDALNLPYVEITGSTADRATPVREFQAGKVPLFLLSLKAGGTGLNLTAADTVIHYDPWWNPAVENQATDRAYRIGQDKPVFVHKLIVEEGIEEAIELLKARKSALADALFAGQSNASLNLSESDISALFAPLGREPLRKRAA